MEISGEHWRSGEFSIMRRLEFLGDYIAERIFSGVERLLLVFFKS